MKWRGSVTSWKFCCEVEILARVGSCKGKDISFSHYCCYECMMRCRIFIRRSSNALIQLDGGNSNGTLTEFCLNFMPPMLLLFWHPMLENHTTSASQAPTTLSPL